MAVSAEILKNVHAAIQAKDPVGEAFWKAKHGEIEALTAAGVIKQLPVESPPQAAPVELVSASITPTESAAQTLPVPNFYIKRAIEGLVLPSVDQLMTTAHKKIKNNF